MDMNSILKLGAQVFMNSQGSGNAGSNLDIGTLTSALSGLSGSKGGIDIASLIGGMQGGGAAGGHVTILVRRWTKSVYLGQSGQQPVRFR